MPMLVVFLINAWKNNFVFSWQLLKVELYFYRFQYKAVSRELMRRVNAAKQKSEKLERKADENNESTDISMQIVDDWLISFFFVFFMDFIVCWDYCILQLYFYRDLKSFFIALLI